MTLTAVTANFGCASPAAQGVQARRRERAEQHAHTLRAREVDLVFAQEIPASGWIEAWRSAGYTVITEERTPYAVRSAVISRHAVTPVSLDSAAYHGSYLAAASIELGCGPVTLVSVHACPSPLTSEYIASGIALIRGAKQRAVGREGQWWDADFVLGTILESCDLRLRRSEAHWMPLEGSWWAVWQIVIKRASGGVPATVSAPD